MTLAALAEMYPGQKWRNASESYHGTHHIVEFINTHFPNKAGLDTCPYAENSRETFRKDTIKPWISAGILEPKAGLATNDKDNSYRFSSYFAALLRSYNTEQWNERLTSVYRNRPNIIRKVMLGIIPCWSLTRLQS